METGFLARVIVVISVLGMGCDGDWMLGTTLVGVVMGEVMAEL